MYPEDGPITQPGDGDVPGGPGPIDPKDPQVPPPPPK